MKLNDLVAYLEPFRAWFTTGGVVALLGLWLRHLNLQRKAKNAEAITAIEAKKAEAVAAIERAKVDKADEADIRDHYATEVGQLRAAMEAQSKRHAEAVERMESHYRGLLSAADTRSEDCQRDRDAMRKEFDADRREKDDQIGALKDLVAGLNRTIVQYSTNAVLNLGDVVSPEVRAAAERVDRIFNEGEGHGNAS